VGELPATAIVARQDYALFSPSNHQDLIQRNWGRARHSLGSPRNGVARHYGTDVDGPMWGGGSWGPDFNKEGKINLSFAFWFSRGRIPSYLGKVQGNHS
jgi:hypothetical protein